MLAYADGSFGVRLDSELAATILVFRRLLAAPQTSVRPLAANIVTDNMLSQSRGVV